MLCNRIASPDLAVSSVRMPVSGFKQDSVLERANLKKPLKESLKRALGEETLKPNGGTRG